MKDCFGVYRYVWKYSYVVEWRNIIADNVVECDHHAEESKTTRDSDRFGKVIYTWMPLCKLPCNDREIGENVDASRRSESLPLEFILWNSKIESKWRIYERNIPSIICKTCDFILFNQIHLYKCIFSIKIYLFFG